MPLLRFPVRNEYSLGHPDLYKHANKEDPKAVLDGVAVAGLVGILRQLGDLAEFAAEVFHGLQEQVMTTASKSHRLMVRVQHIEASLPPLEKAVLAQTSHIHFAYTAGSEWHPRIRNEKNHFVYNDLPRCIMDSYEECRDPPHLQMLDKFDAGGPGSCLKRYSDPTFFKRISGSSIEATAEKLQRDKKTRKSKKKRYSKRNGEISFIESMSSHNSRFHTSSQAVNGRISSQTSSTIDMAKKSDFKDLSNSFDSRSGSDYIERVFNLSSPLQPGDRESRESTSSLVQHRIFCDESSQIVDDNFPCHSSQEQAAPRVSCVTWDEKAEIVKPKGQQWDRDEDPEVLSTSFDIETHNRGTANLENVDQMDVILSDEDTPQLIFDTNQLDEVESELDTFVDALNTIESESENDLDYQTKQEVETNSSDVKNDRNEDRIYGSTEHDSDYYPSTIESHTVPNISPSNGIPCALNSVPSESIVFEQTQISGESSDSDHSLGSNVCASTDNLDVSQVESFFIDGPPAESVFIEFPQAESVVGDGPQAESVVIGRQAESVVIDRQAESVVIDGPQAESVVIHDPQAESVVVHDPQAELVVVHDPQAELVVIDPLEESVFIGPQGESVVFHDPQAESVVIHDPQAESVVVHDPQAESVVIDPQEESVVIDPQAESVVIHDPQAESVVIDRQAESVVIDRQAESVVIDQQAESVVIHDPQAESFVIHDPQAESVIIDGSQAESVVTDSPRAESVAIEGHQGESVVSDARRAESVIIDGPQAESVINDPSSSGSRTWDRSGDKIISSFRESQQSVTFWTNGNLLGLEPSKPPAFAVSNAIGQEYVARSACETVPPNPALKSDGEKEKLITLVKSAESIEAVSGSSNEKVQLPLAYSDSKVEKSIGSQNSFNSGHEGGLYSTSVAVSGTELATDVKVKPTEANQENGGNSSVVFGLGHRLLVNGFRRKLPLARGENLESVGSLVASVLDRDSEHHCDANQPISKTTFVEQFRHGSPLGSLTSSPPLEHMKISFNPIDGLETSKLKLKFPDGNQSHESTRDVFASFQLVPEPNVHGYGSDSDDDTFCRSSPYMSDDYLSHQSESNSEQWESDESPGGNKDHELYDALCRMSSMEAVSSSLQVEGTTKNGICVDHGLHSMYMENGVEPSLSSLSLPSFDAMSPALQGQINSTDPRSIQHLETSREVTPLPPPLPPVQWRVTKPYSDLAEEEQYSVSEAFLHALDLKHLGSTIYQQHEAAPAYQLSSKSDSTVSNFDSKKEQQKLNRQKEANQDANAKWFDEKEDFLHQIRSKSFSLRPTVTARPAFASGPVANVKVTAILEKANAIRQAVGSDDGEDHDNWSDS